MANLLRSATTQGYLLICMPGGCARLLLHNSIITLRPDLGFICRSSSLSCQLLLPCSCILKFAMADQSSKANAAEAAERSKSEALAAAEKGSPVVTLLAKRIRAAKKRLGKIESMEKLRDSGKPMNADQVGCSSMCMARTKLCMHLQRPGRLLDQDHHHACPFGTAISSFSSLAPASLLKSTLTGSFETAHLPTDQMHSP